MNLLTRLVTVVGVGALLCSMAKRRTYARLFRCWLCKRTSYFLTHQVPGECHKACSFCGIDNRLVPGERQGRLPEIRLATSA